MIVPARVPGRNSGVTDMEGMRMLRRGGIIGTVVLLAVSVMLGGCNKGGKQLDLAQQEAAELRERNAALEAQLGERNTRIADLEGRLSQATAAPPINEPTWDRAPAPRGRVNDGFSSDSRGDLRTTLSGDVLFDSGQATIKQSARAQLDKIASDIQRNYPGATVRVEGYTDSDPIRKSKWGTNEALSQARAEAVREHLVRRGIPANRIRAVGMGSTSPKATKAASRRVEIIVLR